MKFILLAPVVIITLLITLTGLAIYFLFQPVISVLSNSTENELIETYENDFGDQDDQWAGFTTIHINHQN